MNEVYNNRKIEMRRLTCQQRVDSLCDEMNAFYKSLEDYINDRSSGLKTRTIKAFLPRKSPFAAFKREYIRMHKDIYPELAAECL